MNPALWIVAAAIAAVVIMFVVQRRFVVERSREINASADKVWDQVVDLAKWKPWSPWIVHEPDCKIEYSEDTRSVGSWNSWDGKLIGAGRITHTKIGEGEIEQRLEFIRPRFKPCRTYWRLKSLGDEGCSLTWGMEGSLPLLVSFFLKSRMQAQIGRDYDLGMGNLERLLRPETDAPRFSYAHPVDIDAVNFIGIKRRCGVDELGPVMEKLFPQLAELLSANGHHPAWMPLTIYNKRHFLSNEFTFTAAIPIDEAAISSLKDKLSDGVFIGRHDGGSNYVETTVEGSYSHLPVAWMVAFDHLKMRRLKFDWRRSPLEIYANDPAAVERGNEIKTRILIPAKG